MVRFIRTISRIHIGPDQKRVVAKFLQNDVPWNNLILLARSEGVDGFLYHHLSHLNDISQPTQALNQLKQSYLSYQQTRIHFENEAEFMSYQLEANGLSALALQGLSLLQVYKVPGLRPMGDIDILVRLPERHQVISSLKAVGFSAPNPEYPNNLIKNRLWLDIHIHVLNIDRIKSRRYIFPKDLSVLWDRAVPLFPSTKGILKPDPIDNFILLAAHTLKHSYSRMIWLTDLNESLIKFIFVPNRWSHLIERARFWNQEKIVLYGLIVIEGILGQNIPLKVKEALGYEKLSVFEKYVLRLKIKNVALSSYAIILWVFAIKGMRKKIEFLKETLFPREDVISQISLDSNKESRFFLRLNRIAQALSLFGNGIRQALSHGPFGSHKI